MHTLDGQGRLTTVRDSNEGGKPARRRYFIGGSDARIIMGDDEGALLRLWHEKRGEVEPQDLSDHLIVQLGRATEEAESVRGEHPRSSHRGTQPRSRPATYDPLFRLRCALAQPHPRATAIFVDELDARSFQNARDCRERRCIACVPPGFDVRNRISMEAGGLRQVPDSPIQCGAGHSHLCACHRHGIVPLSHVLMP